MSNSKSWLAVFRFSRNLLFSCGLLFAVSSPLDAATQVKQATPAPVVDSQEIADLVAQLALASYQERSAASQQLENMRDKAIGHVLAHALSVDSKFGSAAECLNLIEKWSRKFDSEFHGRVALLLDERCKAGAHNERASRLIRRFLDEDYDCTESMAFVLLSTMGASIHWIKDGGYFSVRMRSSCSREDGDSLWPLRKIDSPCHVMFEDSQTIDDYTARNLASSPGLTELFCPKMTEQQVAMLGESKSLKKLYLEDCVTEEATMRALAKIPTLELLSFNKEQSIDLLSTLQLFPALKQVYMNRSNVTDKRLLDYLAACPKLEDLDLSSFKMPAGDFQGLHRFKSAKRLQLPRRADNGLMRQVAEIPALESIEMKYGIITDEAAPYLAKHKYLRSLSIEDTFIADTSCEHIAKLSKLQTLKLDATFVSPAGVAKIENAIPGLEVDGWITAAHDSDYVKALQELQLVGCTVQPDFSVSFDRDESGKVILPYRRVPGCELFYSVSADSTKNARFLQAIQKVSDLKMVRITGGDDAFAKQLLLIPTKGVKVFFVEAQVSKEVKAKLKAYFKK